ADRLGPEIAGEQEAAFPGRGGHASEQHEREVVRREGAALARGGREIARRPEHLDRRVPEPQAVAGGEGLRRDALRGEEAEEQRLRPVRRRLGRGEEGRGGEQAADAERRR